VPPGIDVLVSLISALQLRFGDVYPLLQVTHESALGLTDSSGKVQDGDCGVDANVVIVPLKRSLRQRQHDAAPADAQDPPARVWQRSPHWWQRMVQHAHILRQRCNVRLLLPFV
jgi:hypothetical protein